MADDNEISLPKATITKLVKEFTPSDMRTSAETMEKLLECCTEFVTVVSGQANEIATADNKSTITPDHVLRSLEALGFGGYGPEVRAAWDQMKEESKNAPKLANRRTRAEEEGLSEQEQIRMQQALFAQARARSMNLTEAQEASVRAQFELQRQADEAAAAAGAGAHGQAAPAHAGSIDSAALMPPPPPHVAPQQQQQQQEAGPPGDEVL